MEREVAALIELAAGRSEQAVAMLQAATQAELKLPPPLGLPAPIKPAPELLGEVLIDLGRPGEAVAPFRQALARNANRTLSVQGLARASAAVSQPAPRSSRGTAIPIAAGIAALGAAVLAVRRLATRNHGVRKNRATPKGRPARR
jgi:hypothetical protein